MDTNERLEQRRIVVDTPSQRREVVTEKTEREPQESSVSAGTVGIVAILALVVIGAVVYIVTNKNANEAANREAAAQIAAQQAQQQAAAQQTPIIIQQPVPVQQQPVVVPQPVTVPESGTTIDDSSMLELATKRLSEDPALVLVIPSIANGRAVLTGSVTSSADKIRAETVVKAVRGVKSVDNRISISTP